MEGNMSSSLVTMPQQSTALVSTQWDTPDNRALILKTVAPGLTEVEAAVFFHVARERHLDPLQKQIYAIKRNSWVQELNNGQGGYEQRMTLQVGIDGFRSIANRTGHYMPSDKLPLVEGQGTPELRVTVWVRRYHEASKQWLEFGATAYYREYVQTKKDKVSGKLEPVAMWARMPLSQTEKCAEAKVLRRGWPEELGGMYTPEEIQRDAVEVLPPEQQRKQNKTERELGTMRTSTQPNRGHGNEGTVQTEKTICAECRQENGGHTADCKMNPKNKTKGKQETQQSRAEQWRTREGHDPKVHISLKDAMQLFDLQRDLGIKEEDMKGWLDANFEIQHRHLIRQDQFQLILDTIQKQFGPKPVEQQAPDQQGPDVQDSGLTGLFPEEG
jgi:phage recombination protein Bet